ncbi:hypothetical protein FNH05_13895 [Amycolatopsis rhizosphaerae]|uniref:Uncharacterized protein n=1 Tax=Amycolatopsis rhizosphaerae TaxID=2053003 RepID=A0A558CT33_9PSEU|nr:hypothetical protein [Amycolatopsis rhizosphaerae]TVT51929.1 hypothetical protein FNH05_13895 [Amycolatopsis rhizosphaerae]
MPEVKTFTSIANHGTGLSCAPVMGAPVGLGAGMRSDAALSAGVIVRLRHVTEWTRVSGSDVPAIADYTKAKQPKIHVPHPLLERSP